MMKTHIYKGSLNKKNFYSIKQIINYTNKIQLLKKISFPDIYFLLKKFKKYNYFKTIYK